jgi:cyanophycin synthetase
MIKPYNNKIIEGVIFNSDNMKTNVYNKYDIVIDGEHKTLTRNNKTIHYDNNLNNIDAIKLTSDKRLTNKLLSQHRLPVCKFYIWNKQLSIDENINQMNKHLHFPIVIKYALGEKGNYIYTDIHNNEQALKKINYLIDNNKAILIEEQAIGNKYRIFVLNNEIIYISKDNPPIIKGDGKSTILELIKNYPIFIKNYHEDLIKSQGYSLNSILDIGKEIKVTNVINVSNGADQEYISIESVHPMNIDLFKQTNKLLNLNLSGIDFISTSLSIPNNGKIIEVNSFPGFTNAQNNSSIVERFVRALFK